MNFVGNLEGKYSEIFRDFVELILIHTTTNKVLKIDFELKGD